MNVWTLIRTFRVENAVKGLTSLLLPAALTGIKVPFLVYSVIREVEVIF